MDFNINLNSVNGGAFSDIRGETGFHIACQSGDVELVELIIKKSVDFNIDLNVKDCHGKTGFQHACSSDQVKKLIVDNSDQFNIDLQS